VTTEWELLWRPPFGSAGLVISVVCGLLILGLGVLSTAGRPLWVRGLIFVARLVAVSLVLLLLWRPTWRVADVTRGRDRVVVLVDESASMGLSGTRAGISRMADARRLLAVGADGAQRGWLRRYAVDYFAYGGGLRRSSRRRLTQKRPPKGATTRLLAALEGLRGRYRGRQLAGVVVVSDGRDTAALRAGLTPSLAGRLRGLDVPVNVVLLRTSSVRDVAVVRVIPDDLAFVRNVARVRAQVLVTGALDRPVEVTLRSRGKILQRRLTTGTAERREVVFELVPEKVGTLVGEVTATPLPGEATHANNTRRFVLKVVRDRVRVLQIAGRPSWDVRFLRQHLKRDPNVDLVSFFILRTHLDVTYALPGELSLIEFPVRQLFSTHLSSFDLVVMQDFERYPAAVGIYLDNIAKYVRGGGALALLGGEHTLSRGGFVGTRFARILPVKLLPPGPPSALLSEELFKPRWTSLAEHHPITRARGLPSLPGSVLRGLPALEGLNRVARAHGDTAVLAVHPTLRGEDGRPAPVLAVREVGRGRVLTLLTDSSWLWRFATAGGGGASAYDAFWQRAVRYLLGDPEFDRLRVVTGHHPYPADQPFRVSITASDPKYLPLKGILVAYRVMRTDRSPETEVRSGSGTGTTGAGGELAVTLTLPPGTFRLEAKGVMEGRSVQAQGELVTEGRAAELARVASDPGLLTAVAAATGGRVLSPDTLARARLHPPRVVRLDNLRSEPLVGNVWLLWGLIALALAGEWLLRRRYSLA
jgi:hypothetical protein